MFPAQAGMNRSKSSVNTTNLGVFPAQAGMNRSRGCVP